MPSVTTAVALAGPWESARGDFSRVNREKKSEPVGGNLVVLCSLVGG
jgi:hypothetical protein